MGSRGNKPGRRRALAAGLALGLVGGTAAGLVFGAPGLTGAAGSLVSQTEDSVPADPDVPATQSTGQDERGDRLRESLQELVDDGTITAAQADAVVAHLLQKADEFRGGRGNHGNHGGGRFGRGIFDGEILETLGLDASEVFSQLREGKTLAEIAEGQGVDVQELIDTLVAEASEHIDEAVEAGRLDEAEATERKANLEERITEMVNKTFDGGRLGGHGGGPGRHGDASDDSDRNDSTDAPETTVAPTTTGD